MDKRFGGRFKDWTPLHQGGQAQLYRALDTWTNRVCAIKMGGDSENARAALLHEFSLLSRLRHPCLIESLDLVWDGHVPAHVLEYVPLVPPESLWETGGEAAVHAGLIQAWRGLHYLHRQGLVHGDVSPGNILVWKDGADWRAKVADLGLVQAEEVAVVGGAVRGTVDYLAPEVLRGEGSTVAADWFSLAATAVHWIDGESYFARLDPATALRRMADFEGGLEPARPVSEALATTIRGWSAASGAGRISTGVHQLMSAHGDFGPENHTASVHGVDDVAGVWLKAILEQGASLLTLKGRVGSGRRTVLRTVARALAEAGWADLGDTPAQIGRRAVRDAGGRMDAVELSRAMLEEFEGRRVVLRWPMRLNELEERVLRAFVAGRESDTVVLLAGPVEGDVTGESWLRTHLRVHNDVWVGPDQNAMYKIALDLWEGHPPPDLIRASAADGSLGHVEGPSKSGHLSLESASPLALEVAKRGGGHGDDEELKEEARAIWERVCLGCMQGLLLLAWSDEGMEPVELEGLVGESGALELEGLLCIRSDYSAGARRLIFTDPLIRSAMISVIEESVDDAFLTDVAALVQNHDLELNLTTRFLEKGIFLERASLGALERALASGDYTSVLDYRDAYAAHVESAELDGGGGWDTRFISLFRRAARDIGRLRDEADLLRRELEAKPSEELQRRFVEVLSALGQWEEARRACDQLPPSDWVTLKKIEIMWEVGDYETASNAYDKLESRWSELSPDDVAKYCIDRSRYGLRLRDNSEQLRWLETGRTRAPEKTLSDPVFLNLLGIAKSTRGEGDASVQLLVESTDKSLQLKDWHTLVRAKLNLGAIQESMGNLNLAKQHMADSHSTAIASGSDLFVGQAEILEAFIDSVSGRPGKAIKVSHWADETATRLGDEGLAALNARLKAIIGTYYGLTSIRTLEHLNSLERVPLEALSFCLKLDYKEAYDLLTKYESDVASLTIDEQVNFHKLLAECSTILGISGFAMSIQRARELDERYGEAAPVLDIIEWYSNKDLETSLALNAFGRLVETSRVHDSLYWGFYLMKSLSRFSKKSRVDIKRAVLEGLNGISEDLERIEFKEAFFRLPRIHQTLKFFN